ncbi:acyltransferase [Chthonomonas calidirosea]|uniref:acyltransferase n=1 Tax=Chthonomonas calidirosea TaxID=454171 RepID=UPI0006EC9D6E|nr:acyltransferase [Chthonomonas calidirosea]CEK19148.1 acetyltransferase (isoleucine patch superfamily) [Chthonomonas calidirosea]
MAEPWLNRLYRLSHRYYQLKAMLYYRPMFKKLGKGTAIRKPLLILNPHCIQIGEHVLIREGARLEAIITDPQKQPLLVIGDRTNIEQNVHIVCHRKVVIGSQVTITGNCAIVDVHHPYEDIHDPRKIGERMPQEDSFVEIQDGAFLGMGSVVLPNVTIGHKAVIGANSVVTKSVPDYCVAAGVPARILRRYDPDRGEWTWE